MRLYRWISQRPWLAALVVALALVYLGAAGQIRHVEFVSGLHGELVDPPESEPASPTGYTLNRRQLILPGAGEDGYQWILQTQMMLAGGGWRIHHVDYDNAPAGRDAHWASPLRWWIGLLAWGRHVVSGQPLGAAVEWAALRANPLLLALLLLGLTPAVARRFGSTAASVLAIGMVVAFPFNLYFAADYPDHHGILEACGMLTVLFLLAGGGGLVREAAAVSTAAKDGARTSEAWLPSAGAARRWFAASAVTGGVGLWVSTASEVPVLVGVGFGAVAVAWLSRAGAPDGAWRREPRLWRHWGMVGGATSLAAYLLEYFPSHLGFRLEVNHPLYALAWAGGGELLCRLSRMSGPRGWQYSRREVGPALVAVAAISVLPLVILLTKDRTFLVANRFVWLLGTRYVAEGQSLARFFGHHPSSYLALGGIAPLLLIPAAAGVLLRRSTGLVWRTQALLALAPVLLLLLLTLKEIRWWGLELGLVFAAVAPLLAALDRKPGAQRALRWATAGCGLALLPGAVGVVRGAFQDPGPGPGDVWHLAERDVAQWLRQRAGTDPIVVASTPATTNHLIYYGNCRGLGTLYWENTEGFRHAAAIFAARSADGAHALVRQFGVTHLVLLTWDDFADDFVRFYRDLPPAAPTPTDAFVERLLQGGEPPRWLRPIPCPLPASATLKGQRALVFEVVPEQTPATAAARWLEYLLEMDESGRAAARQAARFPQDLRAQVALARYEGRAGQAAAFAAALERVRGELAQAATLDAGDRIRLALVLAAGGEDATAREELQRALAQLDARALRRLTAGGLQDLFVVMDRLGVPFPSERLRQLALSLYPPMLRPGH